VIGALVAALVALGAGGGPAAALPDLTPAQLAGQHMVFGFSGTTPPADLERRIRRGEAGAVILLGGNVDGLAGARALVRRLQSIPRPAGLDAPLLVMVDQEGGLVRRLPGPPARRASEIGRAGPRSARAAGAAAGRLLRGVGVNVNLAPVADVARPGSALARDGRIFGSSPGRVAAAAVAFADGLRATGVAATAKHFPGLGAATVSTDAAPVTIRLPARTLRAVDLRPFRALVAHDVPLVMLGTAIYPALDPGRPAALSRRIATGELRGRLGFEGVTVTDALDTPALAAEGGTGAVAVRAAAAGSDLLIHTGYDNGVTAADALRRALAADPAARARARERVARVLALRRGMS
jgi:beta-N-acetylhexosaminidase